MTTCVLPSADKPAVRAKGTVRPSERPMMASEMMRGSIRDEGDERVEVSGTIWLSPPLLRRAVLSVSMGVIEDGELLRMQDLDLCDFKDVHRSHVTRGPFTAVKHGALRSNGE